jgi:hypothetical protein
MTVGCQAQKTAQSVHLPNINQGYTAGLLPMTTSVASGQVSKEGDNRAIA